MSWIAQATIAICVLIVVGGAVGYVMLRMIFRFPQEMEREKSNPDQLSRRMDNLEKTLTHIQEVVLSLDDPHYPGLEYTYAQNLIVTGQNPNEL